MAEMLIQSESLTNIADEIRILSGTEEAMGLDAMKTNVSEANADVDIQADLISQIQSALEGKAVGPDSNKTFVVQDTPPEDTSVLWVDPTDNSIDEIPENSGGKSVISYSTPAEVPLENGSQYVFYGETGGTISLEIGSDESGKVEYEVSSGFDVIWLLWMQTSDVQGSLIETSGTRKVVNLSGDFSKIKISSTTTHWVVVKIG